MAIFNPDVGPATNERDYLGYSKGIGTNQTFKTLFEGIGDVGIGAVVAADETIKKNIYDTADKQVNEVRDLFGVADATRPRNIQDAVPSELAVQQDRLNRLKKGYEAGTITETHYLGMLQDIVKGLRSKYPGYEMQIDDTIQKITGLTPANAIIRSIQQEAADEKNAADNSDKRRQNFIDQNLEYLKMAGVDLATIDDYSLPELRVLAGNVQGAKLKMDMTTTSLGIQAKAGELDHTSLITSAREIATSISSQAITAGVNGMGGLSGIQDKIRAFTESGQTPPPEMLAQTSTMLTALKTNITNSVQSRLSVPMDDDNPGLGTIWGHMNAEERADVLQAATESVDRLSKALNGGQWSLASAEAGLAKAMTDADEASLMKSSGAYRALKVLGSIGGPGAGVVIDKFISDSKGEVLNDLSKALGQGIVAQITTNGTGGGDINTVLKSADPRENPKVDRRLVGTILDFATHALGDKDVNSVLTTNTVKFMFKKGGGLDLEQFKPDQRSRVFSKLLSPAATARIQELSKTDPEIWRDYTTWAYSNFTNVFRQAANDIRSVPEPNKGTVLLQYDPEVGQIKATNKALTTKDYPGWSASLDEAAQTSIQNQVKNLNMALASMKPILEADGEDMGKGIQTLLSLLGLSLPETDPNKQKDQSRL